MQAEGTSRRGRRIFAAGVVAAIAWALVGCSSSGTPEASSPKEGAEDWALSYASCMRDEGIDIPDPDGSNPSGAVKVPEGTDPAAFQTADGTCRGELGERPAPPGGEKSEEDYFDQELEAAKCLRDAGFDVPDPVLGEGFGFDMEVPDEVIEKCLASFQTAG